MTDADSPFVMEHGDQQVVVPRPSTYEDALDTVVTQFPELSTTTKTQIRLSAAKLDASGGIGPPVEILDESWPVVSKLIDRVTVSVISIRSSSGSSALQNGGSTGTAFTVQGYFNGHVVQVKVSPTTRFGRLRRAILCQFGLPEDRVRIRCHPINYSGHSGFVPDDTTLSAAGITDEDVIDVHWEQYGGLYPGICLWCPIRQRVDVHLTLSSCWRRVGMALPPATETITPRIDSGSDTSIHWSVDVEDDMLHNVQSQFKSDILYWRAPLHVYEKDDLHLDDNNSVVLPILPVTSLIEYLSEAFECLGVPDKVMNAFMTHTLSRLLGDHTHLAIRFVSQNLLEKHANLSVSPSPQVQTRVILLYKIIHSSWLNKWPHAIARSKLGGQYWKDVVGITENVASRLQDDKLFRVFEWGTVHVTWV